MLTRIVSSTLSTLAWKITGIAKQKRNNYLFEWCDTPRIILVLWFTTDYHTPRWI
jgi:hypothetical protein